jgi:hypothetical protein
MRPGDLGVDPFRTDEERVQVSQYEVVQELRKLIASGEFFDPDHFALEINRAIFGHPLEARLGNFGRDVSSLIRAYDSDDVFANQVLSCIVAQKEREDVKDIPGRIASAWRILCESGHFASEPSDKRIYSLVAQLGKGGADIASALGLVSGAASLSQQPALVAVSFDRVRQYASQDARIIPFSQGVLSPIFRAVGRRAELLSAEDSQGLFERVVDNLYMLDRDLRVSGSVERIASAVEERGVRALLYAELPAPMQVALDSIAPDDSARARFVQLCSDADFSQGRELKRKVYSGLAALEELDAGRDILGHITSNVSDSKGLARILSALSLVHSDPDFSYPSELSGEEAILRNLRLQLIDKSLARLKLGDATLDSYLGKLESDERFARIGKMFTTLAGYSHYQSDPQTALLREVIEAELAGKFNEWRYSHDEAASQLAVLEDRIDAWKSNLSVTRLVGELDGLKAHIDSILQLLPKISETYAAHYSSPFEQDSTESIAKQVEENETALRGELSNRERRDLGYNTALLRERLAYVELLSGLSSLSVDNYGAVLEKAESISKKRSKNPLYETAKWIREQLDSPAYRDARKITVAETDDLETMLRFGEVPVPHCQNWRVNSSLNRSLMSFVADANKKLYHISNGDGKPISMSMSRLVDWNGPTILIENVYSNEWNDDYGIALLGSVADKALAIFKETGKNVAIATNNSLLVKAMEKFGKKYGIEVESGRIEVEPPASKNAFEYWDCGPGMVASGSSVSFDVSYIMFGEEE